jgi:GNAT superfamily N-acetyltransferase/acyl carrier protein
VEPEEIRGAVQAAIASVAPETDWQRIRPGAPLREQIDLDSMDWLKVAFAVHDRLGVDIPEADQARLATLDSIVDYVASRKALPAGAPARAAPTGLASATHRVDGVPVTVRPIRPEDAALEADFVRHLSSETRYKRFMLTLLELPQAKLRYLTEVDQVQHVALVATVEQEGREVEVGVVRYIVAPAGGSCEFAIALDDAWQGSGLAGILMHALIDIARSRGLAVMEGVVLATNARMLKFTRQLGFRVERDPEDRTTVRVLREL